MARQSWRAARATGRASWRYVGRPLLDVTERRAAARSTTKGRPWAHEPDLSKPETIPGRVAPDRAKPKPRTTTARVDTPAPANRRRTAGYLRGSIVAELKGFVAAADRLADAVPENASELDQLLGQLNVVFLRVGESLAAFAEGLDAQVGLDARVSAPLYAMADEIADSAKHGKDARTRFRSLYAALLEAEVKTPKDPEFFADH